MQPNEHEGTIPHHMKKLWNYVSDHRIWSSVIAGLILLGLTGLWAIKVPVFVTSRALLTKLGTSTWHFLSYELSIYTGLLVLVLTALVVAYKLQRPSTKDAESAPQDHSAAEELDPRVRAALQLFTVASVCIEFRC